MANSLYMPEMTNLQVREYLESTARGTVIVPVGSTEDHGDHGPLWTDVYIPIEVAKRAAPDLEALVGPRSGSASPRITAARTGSSTSASRRSCTWCATSASRSRRPASSGSSC
jgi:hypothetical protein